MVIFPPVSGNRNSASGVLTNRGSNGNYWSSSVNGTNAYNLNFNSSDVNPANSNNRANGFSVRCVKYLHMYQKNNNQQLLLDLFQAYFDARKHKGRTANALAFAVHYEENLFELYEEIINGKYKIKPSLCFIVNKPVKREIFAADFRDRIVHHLLYNYISPYFEKDFIKDSYSCRKGKGTLYGIKRVDHFIKSCSLNYQKECWIMKLDIKGYFMSIDKVILYQKLEKKIKLIKNPNFDKKLILSLLHLVIFNPSTKDCRVRGRRNDWAGLPKSKSLFFSQKEKGLPIGNLTSQLCANIYLNEFDHFVRENLGHKYYGRYVDDMVLIHEDKNILKNSKEKIKEYLQSNLGLYIHPKKVYLQKHYAGVYFLGAFIKHRRIYIGYRTKINFSRSVNDIFEINDRQVCSINSYLGAMTHFNTFKLRKNIISKIHQLPISIENIFISENFKKVGLKNS